MSALWHGLRLHGEYDGDELVGVREVEVEDAGAFFDWSEWDWNDRDSVPASSLISGSDVRAVARNVLTPNVRRYLLNNYADDLLAALRAADEREAQDARDQMADEDGEEMRRDG